MYRNAFQKGPSVDVFSPTGTKPCKHWKLQGQISRQFDRDIIGLGINLNGGSSTSKMSLPQTSRSSLHLTQQFLIIQMKLDATKTFSIELGITTNDNSTTRRRIVCSNSFKQTKVSPLNAQLPLNVDNQFDDSEINNSKWFTMCFDLKALTANAFRHEFRNLDSIAIGADCAVRKIFTVRDDPELMAECIPSTLNFPATLEKFPKMWKVDGSVGEEGDSQNIDSTVSESAKENDCNAGNTNKYGKDESVDQHQKTPRSAKRNNMLMSPCNKTPENMAKVAFGYRVSGGSKKKEKGKTPSPKVEVEKVDVVEEAPLPHLEPEAEAEAEAETSASASTPIDSGNDQTTESENSYSFSNAFTNHGDLNTSPYDGNFSMGNSPAASLNSRSVRTSVDDMVRASHEFLRSFGASGRSLNYGGEGDEQQQQKQKQQQQQEDGYYESESDDSSVSEHDGVMPLNESMPRQEDEEDEELAEEDQRVHKPRRPQHQPL